MDYVVINCPHCNELIIIYKNEMNCSIFRHGVLKNSGTQINPHSSKKECELLYKNDLVYGCCKPFKIIQHNNEYKAEICEYI